MNYKERIQRMREEGLLNEGQADTLAASLAPLDDAQINSPRRISPALLFGIALGVVILAALLLSGGSGESMSAAPSIQNVQDMLNQPEGVGQMNKTLSNLISTAVVLLPLILILLIFVWLYNGLVNKEERVNAAWSQVESNYQRRSDLIPNLIESVSRYMKHERETLGEVTAARAEALNPLGKAIDQLIGEQKKAADFRGAKRADLEDENYLKHMAQRQDAVGASLHKLIGVVENYPNLRAADQFLELQAQLEGTENRINIARIQFNEAVQTYNAAIRRLPGNLIASIGRFNRKAYFKSDEGADRAERIEIK